MNVETKLARFVRLFPSVILILVVGAGAITADEPGTQVREYSQIVTVPDGTGQKEVIVNYVTMEQSETIAVPATRRGNTRSSVEITRWRAIAHYPFDAFNHKARTGARTQARECIDTIHAKTMHRYWGDPADKHWGYYKSKTDGGLGCNDDTGEVWASWGHSLYMFANGTTHQAVANHEAEISGVWYEWPGETGPQTTVN